MFVHTQMPCMYVCMCACVDVFLRHSYAENDVAHTKAIQSTNQCFTDGMNGAKIEENRKKVREPHSHTHTHLHTTFLHTTNTHIEFALALMSEK